MTNKKTWTTAQRELLFRKNTGKLRLATYLEKLSAWFATPVVADNLLDLQSGDAFIKKPRTLLQEQKWVCLNPSDKQAIYPADIPHQQIIEFYSDGWQYLDIPKTLLFAQELLNKQPCYLYSLNESYDCGLYQTGRGTQINLDYDFAKHQPDLIKLYSQDNRFSLQLEYSHAAILYNDKQHIRANTLECEYCLYQQ